MFQFLAAMGLVVLTVPALAAPSQIPMPTTDAQTAGATPQNPAPLVTSWGDALWQLQSDLKSGGIVHLENRRDPQHMNWLRKAGHWEGRRWVADKTPALVAPDKQWGLVESARDKLQIAQVRQVSERVWETTYESSTLAVTVRRELQSNGELAESYQFKNTGALALELPVGALSITAPLFDQYPDAKRSLAARCHAHLWMGGTSAWINATRMGMQPPHLGLVMTQGSLDAYSQRGGGFNERGVFLLHPGAMTLAPGKSQTVAWKLFWHTGWDDFFAKLKATKGFVRLTAKNYTVAVGQPLQIAAESANLKGAQIFANGQPVAAQTRNGRLSATIPTTKAGEILVEARQNGRKTWLRANVTLPIDDLIEARLKFIVGKQQRNAPGTPLDGAYLVYDNETGQQIYEDGRWQVNDHNAGRERIGMGILGALYLPQCRDEAFKAELKSSLTRYAAFVERELEDEKGVVYSTVGRCDSERLYNFPWVARFHLAMYWATGENEQLDRFVRVLRAYYKRDGARHISIGIPFVEGTKTLQAAGRTVEKDELLGYFKSHADYLLGIGLDYPSHEVNYEQSIVAPAVQILAETYLVTGNKAYLDAARQQMPVLQAFCGKQPDFRLNEVAIRHWDDYWFGKIKVYGDTLPHYWSTLNATAYAYYGRAVSEPVWFERADTALKGNLALFNPDGSASAAHLYALTSNGKSGARNDPWANDQDWALVNLLTVRAMQSQSSPVR